MDGALGKIDVSGRLDVSVPEAVYEAGRVSTVTILLRNPFDETVEVLEIQGPRSSHLREVVRGSQALTRGSSEHRPRRENGQNTWIRTLFKSISRVFISEVSLGGFRIEFPRQRSALNIVARPSSETVIDSDLSSYEEVNLVVEEGATVRFLPPEKSAESEDHQVLSIAPHCEAAAYFDISTEGWLFFTPTRRSLNTLVRYRVNGQVKTQLVSSQFDVRPPLLSMVIGAIVGSFLGTMAKHLNKAQAIEWQPLIVSLGASFVMSLIATIALSRKTGTQGFITVEDFFGGFVVGALIGYGGSGYFERAIQT
jgi:hypothetical protein